MERMAANIDSTSPAARPPRAFRRPTMFAFAVLAMGLLLWARFLLVTGHPRTAIADPPEPPQAIAAQP
jgi:hypothetical protein